MNQIQYAVPSLHFGENYGNRNISIRGVGSFLEQPGVLTSINGVVQPSDASSQVSLLDLARVEVLRGPQGTLYGRNANGGVVNFIAAAPTDELFGYLKVGFAEYEQTTAEIVVSGPITDRIGFRIAASHLDANEGWVENLEPGDNLSCRLLILRKTYLQISVQLISGCSGNKINHAAICITTIERPLRASEDFDASQVQQANL